MYIYLYAVFCNLLIVQHYEFEKTLERVKAIVYISLFSEIQEVEKACYTCHKCLHLSDYSFIFLLRNK